MKNFHRVIAGIVFGGFVLVAQAGNVNKTPIGYWKTIDDETGKPKSIVQIWKADNQVLMGKVVKIFPKEGGSQEKICSECKGEMHNQPIVGMVIMSGLKAKQSHWDDGKILDPENGKSYSCSLKLNENGKRLNVHGYIGIPLLGRSQTWERIDLMADA